MKAIGLRASTYLFAIAVILCILALSTGCGGEEAGQEYTWRFDDASQAAFDAELVSVNEGGNSLIELKKLPEGAMWTAAYKDPRPMSGPEYHVIDFCPDGSIVAVGDCADFSDWSSEVILGKYDGNGQSLPGWPKFYKGPGSHWNEGQDVKVDTAGNIVVAGYADVWRFDAEGNPLPGWPQSFMGDRSIGTAVIIDSGGDIVVCGSSDGEGYDRFVLKRYRPDGATVEGWPKVYGVDGSQENFAYDLIQDSDGNLVVAGYTQTAGVRLALLYKLDKDGNVLPGWPKTWSAGSGGYDEYFAVSQDAGGDYFLVGISSANWESGKLLVARYSVDGEQLTVSGWPVIYGGNGLRDASPPDSWSGCVDTSGSIAAAATCNPDTHIDTVKYTPKADMADGFPKVIGQAGYYEVTRSCTVDDMNNIYTVGYMEVDDGTHSDYTTFIVKYPPGAYSSGRPALVIEEGVAYNRLNGFSEILGSENMGSTAYQLSPDGEDWYYNDGSGWTVTITGDQANAAAVVDEHIAQFAEGAGSGTLYIKVFLVSDGSQKVQLDSISVEYE